MWLAVIRDIVKRYDVDAIHFDDYFYPYRIAGKEFPDESTFAKYGNGMTKDDWRRSNVDSIIFILSKAIKEENKYCKFGITLLVFGEIKTKILMAAIPGPAKPIMMICTQIFYCG